MYSANTVCILGKWILMEICRFRSIRLKVMSNRQEKISTVRKIERNSAMLPLSVFSKTLTVFLSHLTFISVKRNRHSPCLCCCDPVILPYLLFFLMFSLIWALLELCASYRLPSINIMSLYMCSLHTSD